MEFSGMQRLVDHTERDSALREDFRMLPQVPAAFFATPFSSQNYLEYFA
jgi:hypothetical protein